MCMRYIFIWKTSITEDHPIVASATRPMSLQTQRFHQQKRANKPMTMSTTRKKGNGGIKIEEKQNKQIETVGETFIVVVRQM